MTRPEPKTMLRTCAVLKGAARCGFGLHVC
nr:MAG TPA: hypothetical protein [Caudoviricetes sp.]